MPLAFLDNLPEDARLWVYGFRDPLGDNSRALVAGRLNEFMETWNTHGAAVAGGWGFVEDRFVALAGHNPDGVSGCSTDTSIENFKWLKEKHGLDGFDRTLVFYRDREGRVATTDRSTFQQMVDAGRVTEDTIVFDTTITTVGDLRAGRFETTFGACWHARLFKRRPIADGSSTA